MGFVIFLHVTICVFLALIILMQSGRGGGLTEQFSSAESMFGAKTNVVLVRATAVLASMFIVTSCVLAVMSSKKEKSLMPYKMQTQEQKPISIPLPDMSSSLPATDVKTPEPAPAQTQ